MNEFWRGVSAKGLLQGLLAVVVFALLPLGILELSLYVLNESFVGKNVETLKARHAITLAQLSRSDNDPLFIGKLVRLAYLKMLKYGTADGPKRVVGIRRKLPKNLELYFFDQGGRLIQELSSHERPRKYLERCFRVVDEIVRGGKKIAPERLGLVRDLLKMSRVESLIHYDKGKAMPIGQDPSGGYFFWQNPDSSKKPWVAGYLAFFHPEKFSEEFSARLAITTANRRFPAATYGLMDLGRNQVSFFPKTLDEKKDLRSAALRALSSYNTSFVGDDFLLTIVQRKKNGYFLAIQDIIPPFSAWFFRVLRVAFALWMILVAGKSLSGKFFVELKISSRIIVLFLFSVGLPTGLLLLGGYRALDDHIEILQENLEREMREKISQFDDRFPVEVNRIESWLKSLRTTVMKKGASPHYSKIYKKIRKERAITEFMVVDAAGKDLFILHPPQSEPVAQRYQIGRIMSRELLKRLNKSDVIDGGTFVTESVSGFMGTLTEAGSWELFQRNYGQFTPFGIANEGCFMLFDYLLNKHGEADRMIVAVMNRGSAEGAYFRKNRRALERQPGLSWRVSLWSRSRLFDAILSRKRERADVETIGKAVDSQLSPVRKIVKTSRGAEILIGQLGQNIMGYVVVARASLAPVERQIKRLWTLVATLAGILMFATLAIGLFLSDQLLAPIQHISQGIKAIRDRDFHHTIPVQSHDELGEVSTLMNQVIEGMQDLSVARIIQENLFPQDEIRIGTASVFGRSRTMTDVGGDYFDYVKIDDRYLFGVVGDVSGHGVSAALIMGMAKCFFSLNNSQEIPLGDLLNVFNNYLFQAVKRVKMMTMIVFRLDVESKLLQIGNAGHVSPFLRKAVSGEVTEIQIPCMPLGIKKGARFQMIQMILEQGDSLFFCTDGLPEARDVHGKEIGYEGPHKWFAEVGQLSTRQIVDALFLKLDEHQKGAAVNDDVTMICLKC